MIGYDDELERFKIHINLSEFAASMGYQLDRKESSKNSAVMRNTSNDDKIIVAQSSDGHWTYFSVRDDRDNGSIIDFVQNRTQASLGNVRKELRTWVGDRTAPIPIQSYAKEVIPVAKNRQGVIASFSKCRLVDRSEYLESRGISIETLQDSRFTGMIRQDHRGNLIFPHYDHEGLSGYELKNHRFTGFSRGGLKSVWHSQVHSTDRRLVLVESAIDALSYHQLKGTEDTRYFSTAGQFSPHQKTIIRSAIQKMPSGSTIVSAFDNDAGGEEFHSIVAALNSGVPIHRDCPEGFKDWNDVLCSTP